MKKAPLARVPTSAGTPNIRLRPEIWESVVEICHRERICHQTLIDLAMRAYPALDQSHAVQSFLANYFQGEVLRVRIPRVMSSIDDMIMFDVVPMRERGDITGWGVVWQTATGRSRPFGFFSTEARARAEAHMLAALETERHEE